MNPSWNHSLRATRVQVEKALVEVNRLVEDLRGGDDPESATRALVLALGRVAPLLEQLDEILDREPQTSAPKRVLVVDDSVPERLLLSRALARAGYDVTDAPDAGAAWWLLHAQSFDALVSDVQMPGVDGLELVRRVRASRELAGLRVILNTSADADDDRAHGLEAGADAYVAKTEVGALWVLLDNVGRLTGEERAR